MSQQTRRGLALAAILLASWLGTQLFALLCYSWTWQSVLLAPLLVAALTWLDVGLFIVAHDCMHGSLAPQQHAVNRRVGKLCMMLYAAFDYDALYVKHHQHHAHAGSDRDPDYTHGPTRFWPWYLSFLRRYASVRQLLLIAVAFWSAVLIWRVPFLNVLLFWAVPALLSSLQLFYFGTYLPHRPSASTFADHHRARSNDYPPWLSLLTCFHFGYHHEHHKSPSTPWWQLPQRRAEGRAAELSSPAATA